MDLLWNDDPEELLLELGFGCDEPDLSGRIPARFINYQSQARGINLQVFLEAQKNRIDIENPDVSNRFRQLEVLQQVSVAFSALAGAQKGHYTRDKSPEAQERRRRMGMLLRRASKKSLSQLNSPIQQELTVATAAVVPKALEPMYGPEERKVPFKRVKLQDTVSLSPFVEEEGEEAEADNNTTAHVADGEPRMGTVRERVLQRKRSIQMRESFEMEELGSFEDSSTVGSDPAGTHFVRGLIRVNSCQSDSSGFLEDLLIPALPHDTSPATDLLKALSALSGGSTDSHPGDTPPQNTVCSSVASNDIPEPLPRPGSPLALNQQQDTMVTLDSRSPSPLQSCKQVPHENGIAIDEIFLPSDQFSPAISEPVVNDNQETETKTSSSDIDVIHLKTFGLDEKNMSFAPSPKNEVSMFVHSNNFDKFRPYHNQKSTEEVFRSQVKTEFPGVSHFLSRQDSFESLTLNEEGPVQNVCDSECIVRYPNGPKSQSEDVFETDIDWLGETQNWVDKEMQSEDFCKDSEKEKNFSEDSLCLDELSPQSSPLIEVESLDDVFETSVDNFDIDSGDVETFFQELNTIGQVYWAEPIAIADLSPSSGSLEDLDIFQEPSELAMESDLDVLPSTHKPPLKNDRTVRDSMELITSEIEDESSSMSLTDLKDKTSNRSLSVQMLSSSSSHIVHRKDIPYMENPKHVALPKRFKLDTSDPFRALQSWTDLHIQYNPKFSKVSASAGGSLNRPMESYWSHCRVLAHEWQSDDCLHRTSREEESWSDSRDTGLWEEGEDEEVDRAGVQDSAQTCFTCDKCNCRKHGSQQHMLSQRELEELLLHLQKFCSVLGLMEEQLTEEQAAVYSALTHQDRECVEELLRLRKAVWQEAVELEKQLSDLVHHDDHSLTLNMLRLLDEQSLLCSQLRLFSPGPHSPLSGALSPQSGPVPRRTVATQCSLPKKPPYTGPSKAPGGPQLQPAPPHPALGCAPAKTDKLHLVGFLHRVMRGGDLTTRHLPWGSCPRPGFRVGPRVHQAWLQGGAPGTPGLASGWGPGYTRPGFRVGPRVHQAWLQGGAPGFIGQDSAG
ncbi:uncharacterized protein itprid1 [Eucyclogobius newberryi]|uniref:uncharacterized protein itprid1 n=1 Tax=Eucyclogobius newberryi TaxID=166745 RepID=UPI003B5AF372